MSKFSYIVLSLYKFFEIKNIFNFKNNVAKIFSGIDVKGIILIAPEGINIIPLTSMPLNILLILFLKLKIFFISKNL